MIQMRTNVMMRYREICFKNFWSIVTDNGLTVTIEHRVCK